MQKEAAALKAGKKEMAEMVIAYGSVGLAYRVAALDAQTPKESALNCPPPECSGETGDRATLET